MAQSVLVRFPVGKRAMITVVLAAHFLLSMAVAEPAVAEDQKQPLVKSVMIESGMLASVETAAAIRDEEMKRLAATRGPITARELAAVRARMMASIRVKHLLDQIEVHLNSNFSTSQLQTVLDGLRSPTIEKSRLIKGRVSDAHFDEQIRAYHLRLIEKPPRESRVELMRQLATVERINGLNTIVKVEVRKSLLTAITHVKDNLIPTEQELDRQLTRFRKQVDDKSGKENLEKYLYLFRAISSPELNKMINDYRHSGLESVLSSCETRLKKEFSAARQQHNRVLSAKESALVRR